MTAPSFNFPNLTPQQAVPSRSRLDGFAELLASIQDRRAQRDIAREQLTLEKRRVENSETMDKHQIEQDTRKQDIADRRLRASDAVDRYVAEALQDPHLTPTKLSDIRARMIKENEKDLLPYLNEAFDTELQAQQQTLKSVADRQAAEAGAEVATKTKGNVIANSGVDLDNAKLERTLRELTAKGFDTQRLAGAHDYARASGLPWGVVRKQFGLPNVAGGIPDTYTFPDQSGKGAGDKMASVAATQLQNINDQLNSLGNKGLSIAAYKSLSAGPLTSSALNSMLSKDQQELVGAYAPFIAFIQPVIQKGNASEGDVARIQRAFVTLEDDAPTVKAQKALIRTALAESFDPSGTNYTAMLDKFNAIIKDHGIDPKSPLVAPFLAMRPKLKDAETKAAAAKASGDDPVVTKMLGTPAAAPKRAPRAADVLTRQPVTRPPR
jgi:hypothetical protein